MGTQEWLETGVSHAEADLSALGAISCHNGRNVLPWNATCSPDPGAIRPTPGAAVRISHLPIIVASPLSRPSQRRSRENAARAAIICALRRAEREDVEDFLAREVPEQRGRRA